MSVNSLIMSVNSCALEGDSASLTFNFVNIVTMFAKNWANENESEYESSASMTQTVPKKEDSMAVLF